MNDVGSLFGQHVHCKTLSRNVRAQRMEQKVEENLIFLVRKINGTSNIACFTSYWCLWCTVRLRRDRVTFSYVCESKIVTSMVENIHYCIRKLWLELIPQPIHFNQRVINLAETEKARKVILPLIGFFYIVTNCTVKSLRLGLKTIITMSLRFSFNMQSSDSKYLKRRLRVKTENSIHSITFMKYVYLI